LESINPSADGWGIGLEAEMPGNPKECRQHALNCMILAKGATTAEAKQTFHNLAQSWTRLAVELESAQTFLNALTDAIDQGDEALQAPTPAQKRRRSRVARPV
jgi:hypothetical protein